MRELRGANWEQRNTRREMDIGVGAEADRAPVFESRGIYLKIKRPRQAPLCSSRIPHPAFR